MKTHVDDAAAPVLDPVEGDRGQGRPRVVIAHDYLTQRGGAERVVLALSRVFPDAPIVTSIYDPDGTFPEFRSRTIRTSPLSKVSTFRRDPRRALALLPRAWSNLHVSEADVVLCSSTGWAHGVHTNATKIVYCHNPARWLYQQDEYLPGSGRLAGWALKVLRRPLIRWDQRAAGTAEAYLANSSVVAERIKEIYGRQAEVVHPPASVEHGPAEPVPGVEPGFLLTVGRARGYKNTALVAEAVRAMPGERLVAVGGLNGVEPCDRITELRDVSDGQLRWLYQNAAALVACGYEDFGLTPIEAYTNGTPVIALRAGGYLDTMVEHVTGEFVESASCAEIISGITRLRAGTFSADAIRAHGERFSLDAFALRIRQIVNDQHPTVTDTR